jgi:hypothetical protein
MKATFFYCILFSFICSSPVIAQDCSSLLEPTDNQLFERSTIPLVNQSISLWIDSWKEQEASPWELKRKKKNRSKSIESGYFSITQRNSVSLWGLNQWRLTGLGKGTAFRIRLTKRLNSEWYGDVIKTQYKGKVVRRDRHLTNSLMFYLRKPDTNKLQIFRPFISASIFCFDFTRVDEVKPGGQSLSRFSLSQQFGLGTHFFITDRADISIYAQYYNHLGNDIHIDEHPDGSIHLVEVRERISLEGHMFLVFSVGYRFADLWGKKKK